MSVYVVRLQRNNPAHPCLVGIYLAKSVEELEQLVERCCSKFVCEYAEIPHGCMYGPESSDPAGEPLYEERIDPKFTSVDDLSDDWRELFFGSAPVTWRNFCAAPWRSEPAREQAFATARRVLQAA